MTESGSTDGRDLSILQRLLRESKELTARGQGMLDDPDLADLISTYQDLLERAIQQGNVKVARKAAAHLKNLQEKKHNLGTAQAVSDAAERNGIQVIVDELDRRK